MQKLKATLKTAMLAKATLEFAMRTSKLKPKAAEKFERLKEEEAKARAAVEEFQTHMKWNDGDSEDEEDEEEPEEEREEPRNKEEQAPKEQPQVKPQVVKPPVPVFQEPPPKMTEPEVPWRVDTRRKREDEEKESESEKEGNKRQKGESSAPPLPKPPTYLDPKAKERAAARRQVEEMQKEGMAELVPERGGLEASFCKLVRTKARYE